MSPIMRRFAVFSCTIMLAAASAQCILAWDATRRVSVSAGDPVTKKLDACWNDLASADAKAAFAAMGDMIGLPKESVALLATKLQPVEAVAVEVIDKYVADLDSNTFAVRQKSTKELEKLGGQARPALEKMLAKPPSAEAHSRAKKLLEQLDGPVTSKDTLRGIRAVEVLERIATPEARELLTRLANGAPSARLTEEARESLARLKKQIS